MTIVKRNENLEAIIEELEAVGATYEIDHSSRHYKISYEYEGNKGITFCTRASNSRSTGFREIRNARAQIRRDLRNIKDSVFNEVEASNEQQHDENVVSPITIEGQQVMDVIKLNTESLVVTGSGEARMRDVDIASALGFTKLTNVRQLIESNMAELQSYGQVSSSELIAKNSGGRPGRSYLLNREQSLLIALFSRTPRASEVRHQVITAFTEFENKANAQSQIAAPAVEPEIIMNGQAIDTIVARLSGVISTPTASDSALTHEAFNDGMRKLVSWMVSQSEQQRKNIGDPTSDLEARIGALIDQRLEKTQRTLIEMLSSTAISSPVEAQEEQDPSDHADDEADDETPNFIELESEVTTLSQGSDPRLKSLARGVEGDFMTIGDIYEMLGFAPNTTRKRMSLSQRMRHSMDKFNKGYGAEKILALDKRTNMPANHWPRDFVTAWYQKSGRRLLSKHLIA